MNAANYRTEDQNLVLGTYPTEFLREVRQAEGGNFFCSEYANETSYWDIFDEDGRAAHVAGTMLPIDRKSKARKFPPDGHDGPLYTESWQLGEDGRVLAADVALIASTDPTFFDPELAQDLQVLTRELRKEDPSRLSSTETSVGIVQYMEGTLAWVQGCKHAVIVARKELFAHGSFPSGFDAKGAILVELPGAENRRKNFGRLVDFRVACAPVLSPRILRDAHWEIW